MSDHRRLAGGVLVAAAGTTVAARSSAWHRVDQTGFSLVGGAFDVCLVALAVVCLVAGVGLAVRPRAGVEAVAALAAVVLASMLTAALLMLGDTSDKPDSGAWLAGGAVVLLGIAAVLLRLRRRAVQALAVVAVIGVAVAAVLVPPDRPFQEVEVIR